MKYVFYTDPVYNLRCWTQCPAMHVLFVRNCLLKLDHSFSFNLLPFFIKHLFILGGNFRDHSHENKDFTVRIFLYEFYPPRTSDEFDLYIAATVSNNNPVKDYVLVYHLYTSVSSFDLVLIVSSLFRFVFIDKIKVLFIRQFNSFWFSIYFEEHTRCRQNLRSHGRLWPKIKRNRLRHVCKWRSTIETYRV
jgi:hypothetical protein